MPQLAVAVAAAEIGTAAFGAEVIALGMTAGQIGFAAGSVIGSVLFAPTQKSSGPRLADLKAGQVTYGSVIPYVEGHPRLGAIVVWASDKRELTTTTSQGKGGGGESTSFSYEQDVLVMLCENVQPSLRRSWKNGELVWTPATDASDHWDELIFYGGGPTQMPDPTYEAVVGTANAPAYRTRTTVMLRGLKLGTSGQLPNITFEVGPDATRTRAGTVLTLWNFGDTGSLALPPYPGGANPTATATKNDLSELVTPNTWTLYGHNHADCFIGPTGLSLQEYQAAAAFSCGVFQSNTAWTISGDFTIEYRLNPSGDAWASSSNTAYILSATSGGGAGAGVNGDWQLLKQWTGSIEQLAFSMRIGGSVYSVNSGTTSLPAFTLSEVSIVRSGATLMLFMNGALVGSIACATGDIGGSVLNVGGRNGGAHLIPNDFAPGLYTGLRVTSGLARYTAAYATGQAWTLDGSVIDTTTYASEPTIQEVVERQCARAGMNMAYVDASALATRNLHAMAISQLASPRSVIEMLMTAYGFQATESDKLYFTWRGAAAAATIHWDELIVVNQGTPMPVTKANDIELPVQVFVKYMNLLDDYQDGSESSDRMISAGQNTTQVELPLGLTPWEARRIADFEVTDAAASNFRFGPFALDRSYSYLEPSDVVNIVAADGVTTFTLRLTKKTEAGGLLTYEGLSDDAGALISILSTDTTGLTTSTDVRAPVDTTLVLLDIPLLADADDGPGFYADVKAATDVSFPGAALFKSDDDVTFASVGTSPTEGVFGTALTVLASGRVGVFDEGGLVTVDVGFGELASSTRDVLLAGNTNLMALGGELIQFRDAALLSPGVYTLSGLLRGRKGTEWAVGTHVAGEAAVLLDGAVKHVGLANAELGVAKHYKGVTVGRTTATADSQAFTANGVSSKPYAVADLRKADAGGGTFALAWRRRSRMGSRFLGPLSSSVPLGEASEAYAVDVLDGSNVLQSTQTVSANAATVTATSGWKARVYQLSATVGRGYVAEITL